MTDVRRWREVACHGAVSGMLFVTALTLATRADAQTNCTGGAQPKAIAYQGATPWTPLIVPTDCNYMEVKMWGGGGNAGCTLASPSTCYAPDGSSGGNGGGAGAVIFTTKVDPGDTYSVGIYDHLLNPHHGGRSAAIKAPGDTLLAIAGSGGGGGENRDPYNGCHPVASGVAGPGGPGDVRPRPPHPVYAELTGPGCTPPTVLHALVGAGGAGGSLSAGGAGGSAVGATSGHPGQFWDYGPGPGGEPGEYAAGWGGHGYFGGGGGAGVGSGALAISGGGGGGGSSFVDPYLTTSANTFAGFGSQAGNAADADRGLADASGRKAGDGGTPQTVVGKHGRVVVRFKATPF